MDGDMTSIKDVAALAGVSTATVSRVLSNSSYVSDEVRTKVMSAVEASGYRPNRLARSLRVQSSSTIGLIVADIQNPFFTSISRAVQDAAYENGFNIFLCNTDESPEKEEVYLQLMRDEHAAGIIIAPTHQTEQSIRRIISHDIPCVVIDREIKDAAVDTVVIDNEDSGYRLGRHLLEQGNTRLCVIAGSGSTTGALRVKGIMRALNEEGLDEKHAKVVYVRASEEEGFRAAEEIVSGAKRFDALVATNGLLAAGIYRRLREAKISMPHELAFACFDETPWTGLVEPGITVIRQPTEEIGRTAAELLCRRIKEEDAGSTRKVVLTAELVERGSTTGGAPVTE